MVVLHLLSVCRRGLLMLIARVIGIIFLIPALLINASLLIRLVREQRRLHRWFDERNEELFKVLDETCVRACALCRAAEDSQVKISFTINGVEGERSPITVEPETHGTHTLIGDIRTPDGQSGPQKLPCTAVSIRGFSNSLLQQMLEQKYGGKNGKTA